MERLKYMYQRLLDWLNEWEEEVLAVLRVSVATLTFMLAMSNLHDLYIEQLGVTISSLHTMYIMLIFSMIVILSLHHTLRMRGVVYEAALAFLYPLGYLFVCFLTHAFTAGMIIFAVWLAGLAAVILFGKKLCARMLENKEIPQPLLRDIYATASAGGKHRPLERILLRRYLVIGSAALMLVPALMMLTVYGFYPTAQVDDSPVHEETAVRADKGASAIQLPSINPLMANLSTLAKLDNEVWNGLTEQEKANVMQVVADIETQYLGIGRVTVQFAQLDKWHEGVYDRQNRVISLRLREGYEYEYERDAMLTLYALLHECRHAFQSDCVDSLDWENEELVSGPYFHQARQWKYEFENYIDGSVDYEGYEKQAIEVDADEYAMKNFDIYKDYIDLANLPVR